MADYIGDFRLGDTFYFNFPTSISVNGVTTLTTLAGTPVISAYANDNLTEFATGITLTPDFDSRTGLNNVKVIASSGNGFATATDYTLVVTTGTVGGQSVVGWPVGLFSIEHRSAVMPTTAARTLLVDASGKVELDATSQGAIITAMFAHAFAAAYGSYTFEQLIGMDSVALLAICSGMGTATGVFRNLANTADVISATIDANGNRSAVTLTP